MAERTNISTASSYETLYGFSRAVRVGDSVFVAGTTAMQPDGVMAGVGDAHAQGLAALKTIEKALNEAGAALSDVVRTRVYITDLAHLEGATKAHRAVFADIRPASTVVEVAGLVHPDMLIEIEADAVIGG